MRSCSLLAWAMLAALLLCPAVAAADEPVTQAAYDALREQVTGLDGDERLYRLARLSWIEEVDADLRQLARQRLGEELSGAGRALRRVFVEAPPEVRIEILDLYRENWDRLGRGVDGWRREMIRWGLDSEDAGVRYAAARLAASVPIPYSTHPMIDAAILHPELELAAVLTVAVNADRHGLRWVLDTAARRDGDVRRAALYAIARVGPPARLQLIERLASDDFPTARLALDGLLLVAGPDDGPRLIAWVERHAEEDPETARRVTRAVAEIEAGRYEPQQPARPSLD